MSRRITLMAAMLTGFALMLFVALPASSVGQSKDPNELGRKLYQQYCASCHGTDARGNGPVAAALKMPPSDLTILAKRHGHFDRLAIENDINGEVNIIAHGSSEMPVWGSYFRRQRGRDVSTLNIYALTKYLEEIQMK